MSKITCIAAAGLPLENSGYMVPIFQKRDGKCFEVGGRNFSSSVLDDLIEEKAAILIDPVVPKGSGFSTSRLRHSSEEADHYGFAAYVFFFSKRAAECLGGYQEIEGIASKHKGIRVMPKGDAGQNWKDYVFLLTDRKNLVKGFIPQVIHLCRDTINEILADRIKSRKDESKYLVGGKQDDLAEIAQIMMNIADRDSLDEAIRYYGAMLLLSPLASNFRVWLDLVLRRWEHPIRDMEYWRNSAYGVFDAAEQRAILMSSGNRRAQGIALQHRVARNEKQILSLKDSVEKIKGSVEKIEKERSQLAASAQKPKSQYMPQGFPTIVFDSSTKFDFSLKKPEIYGRNAISPVAESVNSVSPSARSEREIHEYKVQGGP